MKYLDNIFNLHRPFSADITKGIEGFSGGKVTIPELDIEVMLRPNEFYKKEVVPNVFARKKEIIGYLEGDTSRLEYVGEDGAHIKLEGNFFGKRGLGHLVLINERLDEINKIHVSGHENGHFLCDSNNQELIYQKYKENRDLITENVHNDEDFAILCGFTALKLANYNLDTLKIQSKILSEPEGTYRLKRLVTDMLGAPKNY